MRRWCSLGALALLLSLAGTARADTAPPHVTVIGDSVMTAVWWHGEPLALATHGFDVDWEVAVCRTIAGQSCPFEGSRPPTLLDLVRTEGARLGQTVLVEVGYNDPPADFGQEVDEAVWALAGVGVRHVIWLTLHESLPQYTAMNAALEAATARHPELTVADWNAAAQGHPDWFQDDGIHLNAAGSDGLATFVNAALVRAFAPPTPQPQTPAPQVATAPPPEVLLWHGIFRVTSRSRG